MVLVTAAAGGTGQFAVQLAKLAGCHVIAVCGSETKAAVARQLGANHVIDYKCQDVRVRAAGRGSGLGAGRCSVLGAGGTGLPDASSHAWRHAARQQHRAMVHLCCGHVAGISMEHHMSTSLAPCLARATLYAAGRRCGHGLVACTHAAYHQSHGTRLATRRWSSLCAAYVPSCRLSYRDCALAVWMWCMRAWGASCRRRCCPTSPLEAGCCR